MPVRSHLLGAAAALVLSLTAPSVLAEGGSSASAGQGQGGQSDGGQAGATGAGPAGAGGEGGEGDPRGPEYSGAPEWIEPRSPAPRSTRRARLIASCRPATPDDSCLHEFGYESEAVTVRDAARFGTVLEVRM